MDFQAAVDIAKKHPGAVITRDDSGRFIVRLADGTAIGSPIGGSETHENAIRDREELIEELEQLQAVHSAKETQLREEIAVLTETIRDLKGKYTAARLDTQNLTQELEFLRSEDEQLRQMLSKVSDAELERIKMENRREREAESARRKAERSIVKCRCRGEVENCARCDGAGQYTVDGYGNRV
jgi:chromosome segregation ATPase